MDPNTLDVPELRDLLNKLDEKDSLTGDKHFLPDEVRFAKLRGYADAQLQGRYEYYLREYTFELNKRKRAEFYREYIRTLFVIRERAYEKRQEAIKSALTGEFGRAEAFTPDLPVAA